MEKNETLMSECQSYLHGWVYLHDQVKLLGVIAPVAIFNQEQ